MRHTLRQVAKRDYNIPVSLRILGFLDINMFSLDWWRVHTHTLAAALVAGLSVWLVVYGQVRAS